METQVINVAIGNRAIEMPETITVQSKGLTHTIHLDRFSEEGIRVWTIRAARYITDGAPLIDEDNVEESTEKRRLAVEAKLDGLYGIKPIREGHGDPAASVLKGHLRRYLAKHLGWSTKECKVKMGLTVAEVVTYAKSVSVPKAWIVKAVKASEEEIERLRTSREGLDI